jgi:hypothetical protein
MKVKALIGFVDRVDGRKYIVPQDSVLELPEGANWLDVGFAEAVEEEDKPPAKKATKKKGSSKK